MQVNYINLLRQADLNDNEKEILSKEINEVDELYHNKGFIGFLLVKLIKFIF